MDRKIPQKSLEMNLTQFNQKSNETNSDSCSISSDLEKNFETLLDEINSVEDLNQAKIEMSNHEDSKSENEKRITVINENEQIANIKQGELAMISDASKISSEENSSHEKSEKYDEIIEISYDKTENIEKNAKRVSAENGSLITQSSWNSLIPHCKSKKQNEIINQSNSFDWSSNECISPLISNSHRLNSSLAFHPSSIGKSGKQPSNIGNKNYQEIADTHGIYDTNHINNFTQFRHNSAKLYMSSPFKLSNPTGNHNDPIPHSINFDLNYKTQNYPGPNLPTNPAIKDFELHNSFSDAFSFNRDILNNFGSKNSPKLFVNNNLNNSRPRTREMDGLNNTGNSRANQNLNKNQNNIRSNTIINETNKYSNFSKNQTLNKPYSNVPKNINSVYYLNFNNYLCYNDEKNLLENINILLQEQAGCRFVQLKIEEMTRKNDVTFLNNFFEAVKHNMINIIKDQFGNYVIQKFFEGIVLEPHLLSKFFQTIRIGLFSISIHRFGTRFFQKSLESLAVVYDKTENEVLNQIFRDLITNYSYDLIIDTNGNHVFQKILMIYPKDKNQFIYNELNKISLEVSKIKQGGCIFQRAFEIATPTQTILLIKKILNNIESLINDEYGNFIIQNVIYLKIPEVNESIYNFLKERLLELSKKKFSSNVIDKVL